MSEQLPLSLLGLAFFLAWEIVLAPFEQALGVGEPLAGVPRFYISSFVTAALLVAAALRARRAGNAAWGGRIVAACGACALLVPAFDLVGAASPLSGTAAGDVLVLLAALPKSAAIAGLFLA